MKGARAKPSISEVFRGVLSHAIHLDGAALSTIAAWALRNSSLLNHPCIGGQTWAGAEGEHNGEESLRWIPTRQDRSLTNVGPIPRMPCDEVPRRIGVGLAV